ncbi:MAG: hypothetical protein WDN00_18700 [Limisphaerales bacterium]
MLVSLSFVAWPGRAHPSKDFVEGDVIVTFKRTVTLNSAERALAGHALVLKRHFGEISRHLGKHSGLIHDDRRTTAQLIADLGNDPAIETG